MYGRGLYRHDSLLVGSLNRETDAATLLVAVPLLVCALCWYRRGSLRGGLLLIGALSYCLYVYASAALGATAYNPFVLVYITLFSASFFALVLLLTAFDLQNLRSLLSPSLPWRRAGAFMAVCGVATVVIWLGMGLLPALIRGEPPTSLDSYSTVVTDALDLGLISPAAFLVGYLLVRRAPLGYLLSFPLLGVLVLLGPAFVAQPISQTAAGVSLSPAEIVGPICGFGVLSLGASWLLVALLRSVDEPKLGVPEEENGTEPDLLDPVRRGRASSVLPDGSPV